VGRKVGLKTQKMFKRKKSDAPGGHCQARGQYHKGPLRGSRRIKLHGTKEKKKEHGRLEIR